MQHNLSNGKKCDEVDRRTARLTDKNANGKVHRHAIDASTDRKAIKNRKDKHVRAKLFRKNL